MILYFSATGNCKYVAERIAEATNDKAVSILSEEAKIQGEVCCGIVTPTYAWGIPSVVEDFLSKNKLTIKDDYLYFLATYGTTPGQSGYFANKSLKETSGIEFDAYFSVKMPDTWTPMFDLSDKDKVAKTNENVEPQLDDIISFIINKQSGNYMKNRVPSIARIVYRPYYNHMRKTKKFFVEESCTGCGLCAKKCPVNAIEIEDGKPVWTKDKCVMCLGCLHRCPKFSIQYGNNTKTHGQYKNPHGTY